jgi:threonine/homoserine/homoserine lactone efflux protein
MWRSKGKMSIGENKLSDVSRGSLFTQGFVTAIANPKGWAFMISLLPPFISVDHDVAPQLLMLLGVIMLTEFASMMAYAAGGKSLRIFLSRGNNIKWMNRIAGSLMVSVGIWLTLS